MADTWTGLDWQGFLAAHFPGRRRHDFEALMAYGAYRRGEQWRGANRAPAAVGRAEDATALEVWEDEGGPVAKGKALGWCGEAGAPAGR